MEPQQPRFPTFQRIFRRLGDRRTLARMAFVVAALLTVVALFYAVENWRGKRAWIEYRQAVESQGAVLDFQSLIPEPIPEEDNFAAIPLFEYVLASNAVPADVKRSLEQISRAMSIMGRATRRQGESSSGRHEFWLNMAAWERALAEAAARDAEERAPTDLPVPENHDDAASARVVLAGLAPLEPVFQQLSAARERPQARYPVQYQIDQPWATLLPHLSVIRELAQALALRTSAQLVSGDTEAAMAGVELLLRLSDSLESEPILISHMVRLAAFRTTAKVIEETTRRHAWSESQLRRLQENISSINFLSHLDRSLEAERASGLATIEGIRRTRQADVMVSSDELERERSLLLRLLPRGWFHLEQRNYARSLDPSVFRTYDIESRNFDPGLAERNWRNVKSQLPVKWGALFDQQLFTRLLLPAIPNALARTAEAQNRAHELVIELALERFHGKHRGYPDKLGELVPGELSAVPQDVLTGAPPLYRLSDKTDSFTLTFLNWKEASLAPPR